MNKNTLTFERKLYVAPACKTHVLAMEEGMMQGGATVSGGYGTAGGAGGIMDVNEYGETDENLF